MPLIMEVGWRSYYLFIFCLLLPNIYSDGYQAGELEHKHIFLFKYICAK